MESFRFTGEKREDSAKSSHKTYTEVSLISILHYWNICPNQQTNTDTL